MGAAVVAGAADKRLSLPIIRRHLESVDAAELERLAVAFLPELATPTVAAIAPAPAPSVAPATASPSVNDTWQRLALLPGLEIHLHSAASAEVRALARRLVEQLVGDAERVDVWGRSCHKKSCESPGSACWVRRSDF